jgi:hypothetical protein
VKSDTRIFVRRRGKNSQKVNLKNHFGSLDLEGHVAKIHTYQNTKYWEDNGEDERKLVKREFTKSSGPSIGKDVW